MPEGEPLDVSALGGSGDTDLTDLAEQQHGAYAAPTQWRTPTGEPVNARRLIIPIGGGSEVYTMPPLGLNSYRTTVNRCVSVKVSPVMRTK